MSDLAVAFVHSIMAHALSAWLMILGAATNDLSPDLTPLMSCLTQHEPLQEASSLLFDPH